MGIAAHITAASPGGFFNAGEFGWELVASIYLEGQKAWQPEASYVPGTPGAVALTHVHSYGTGVFRRSTSWYRIAKGEPKPFLSYPHEFHVYGWGMPFGRKLTSSHVRMPESLSIGELLKIQFDISYSIYDELFTDSPEDRLSTDSDTLSLEWDAMAGVFMPHTASDNPVRIEALWDEGTKQFLERNRTALENLARSGTTRQKDFISEQLA